MDPTTFKRTIKEIGEGVKNVNGLSVTQLNHDITGLAEHTGHVFSSLTGGLMQH